MLVPPSALKEMNHEILLIHGHQDRFVQLQSSLYVMDYLPNAQLHIFKRCGHWAQVEQKERFIKLTSDFFNGEL
jgi:2-hydroxymuconate-semialdehyde hydrolase